MTGPITHNVFLEKAISMLRDIKHEYGFDDELIEAIEKIEKLLSQLKR